MNDEVEFENVVTNRDIINSLSNEGFSLCLIYGDFIHMACLETDKCLKNCHQCVTNWLATNINKN